MVGKLVSWIDRRFYLAFQDNWDDRILGNLIHEHLGPGQVLDLGAGAGILDFLDLRGRGRVIVGLDLDPAIGNNTLLDFAVIGSGDHLPFPDAAFDLVVANNLLEHLENAERVFSEIIRTMKPGGVLIFKTPNKYHYVPLIARLTPHRLHALMVRGRGRSKEDVFPTYYRANSRRKLMKIADRSGFREVRLTTVEGRPEYCRIAWPIYLVGLIYERVVNATRVLSGLRVVIIGEMKKPPLP